MLKEEDLEDIGTFYGVVDYIPDEFETSNNLDYEDALQNSLDNNLYFLYQCMKRGLYKQESYKKFFEYVQFGHDDSCHQTYGPSDPKEVDRWGLFTGEWWESDVVDCRLLTMIFGPSDSVKSLHDKMDRAKTHVTGEMIEDRTIKVEEVEEITQKMDKITEMTGSETDPIKEHYLMAYYGCIHVLQDLNDKHYKRAVIHGITTNTFFATYIFRMEKENDVHKLCQFCVSTFIDKGYYKEEWVKRFKPAFFNFGCHRIHHRNTLTQIWMHFLPSFDNSAEIILPKHLCTADINMIYYAKLRGENCDKAVDCARQLGFVYKVFDRETFEYLDKPLKLPLSALDEMLHTTEKVEQQYPNEYYNERYEQEMMSRLQKMNADRGAAPFRTYASVLAELLAERSK